MWPELVVSILCLSALVLNVGNDVSRLLACGLVLVPCMYRSRGLAAGSCAVYVRYLQESWVLLLTGAGAVYWA